MVPALASHAALTLTDLQFNVHSMDSLSESGLGLRNTAVRLSHAT